MAGFIGLGYLGIRYLLARPGTASQFSALLLAMITIFFWLKKYAFIPSTIYLPSPYVTIGLSYIFFRVLQMLIDAHEEALEQRIRWVDYLNYTLNFSTLISGPIQRYQDFMANRHEPAPLDWIAAGRAVERIVVGAFKVMVLAGIFLTWHREGLADIAVEAESLSRALKGMQIVVGYTFYLYCNFSGYTDLMIGVARFFHFELPENFDRPFSAPNFMEFWGRWHMTLSNWLKTYVYNPLVKALMTRMLTPGADAFIGVFAFFVTFFLIGLWHGQTWVFALYGFLLGLGVSGNKLYQIVLSQLLGRKGYKALAINLVYKTVARGLTFTWFTLSLVCFWGDWERIVFLVETLGTAGTAWLCLLLLLASSILLALWESLYTWAVDIADANVAIPSRYFRTAWTTALMLVTLAVVFLISTPAPDIVYKNF
jgi:alginate O-acetyltransferase complex protein AlgI